MATFHLQIAAPDGMRFDGEATQLSVRSIDGEVAVLAGHIPYVTALSAGECRVYTTDGNVRHATCDGGILKVTKEVTRLLSASFVWKE